MFCHSSVELKQTRQVDPSRRFAYGRIADGTAIVTSRSQMNNLRADDQSRSQIDELMDLFYRVVSFDEGGTPDWESMAQLFSKQARITRVTPEAIDYLDLNGFRNMAEELIEVGAFTSFFEREIARRVDRYGNVMHIASAYETKISPDAVDYIERGVNSLQLVQEDGNWKICSLCWDDQASSSAEQLERQGSLATE